VRTQRDADGEVRIVGKVTERDVRASFLTRFLETIQKEYIAEFGDGLASLSARCDERVPFAASYPPAATCY
jgi:hypothetical protein